MTTPTRAHRPDTADSAATPNGEPQGGATTTHPAAVSQLDTIPDAIAALRAGRPIIVVDDEDRENEGDLIMPAQSVTPEWMGFIIRHSSGVVCAPMTASRAAELELPPMVADNQDPKGTAYTVSCDAAFGTSTGISAADRTVTVHVLADSASTPEHLNRPGHVFPLIAKDGGVRERAGHTEAGVEFSRLAGFAPVSVIAELVHDAGHMMRLDDLLAFGREHGLAVVSIEDLAAHLNALDAEAARTAVPRSTEPVTLPTVHGDFQARAWLVDGVEHLTLTVPEQPAEVGADSAAKAAATPVTTTATAGAPAPLVRVHSECLTGDVFGSHRCDCGEQLDESLRLIAAHGGTLVYLRGQEGRGIGLFNKLRAYALQEHGRDTVDANTELGLPVDARDYAAASAILRETGATRVRLLTNNPAKVAALRAHGIDVADRVPLEIAPRRENAAYLRTKRERMSHVLTIADAPTAAATSPATASPSDSSAIPHSAHTERRAS